MPTQWILRCAQDDGGGDVFLFLRLCDGHPAPPARISSRPLSMNPRKLTWPALALVLLLAGTVWWWRSRPPAPALPAMQSQASLPAQFNELLAAAHRAAIASPADPVAVRR